MVTNYPQQLTATGMNTHNGETLVNRAMLRLSQFFCGLRGHDNGGADLGAVSSSRGRGSMNTAEPYLARLCSWVLACASMTGLNARALYACRPRAGEDPRTPPWLALQPLCSWMP